jgi:hypothetical protein
MLNHFIENILENGLSNAIARADSRDLTICGSMRRLFMLMKIYPRILWQRLAQGFKGRFGRTEHDKQGVDRGHQQLEVVSVQCVDTIETRYLPQASLQVSLIPQQMIEGVHHHCRWQGTKGILESIFSVQTVRDNTSSGHIPLEATAHQPPPPSRPAKVARDSALLYSRQSHHTLELIVSIPILGMLVGDYLYHRREIHSSHPMVDMLQLRICRPMLDTRPRVACLVALQHHRALPSPDGNRCPVLEKRLISDEEHGTQKATNTRLTTVGCPMS